jgi:signal transduction histidine kinase
MTLEQRRKELPDEAIDQMIAELSRAARRLDRLLVDLLDVERIRRGVVDLNRQRIDVRELVERAVAACALDGRHVTIGGGPVMADVDPAKVERLVENLVLNAVKHTPRESSIEVRLDFEDADLLLTVEDDGPGIPDEFKEAVFEIFNRGPSLLSPTPGVGIGLALVARVAAVHGGRAWVEDVAGRGASFRVLLPDCVRAEPARSDLLRA